ncbi:hypothetical protein BCR42DRAFT_457606 [Absidia repens]|uniref:Heterokaryon incompatibility domain-containing protein n=1 Tax=Absidia repens TaxID=90262 RepID=A0A1X2HBF1_9FUNG|nr:hypothetical protein BCR42DRAFT_457606 [Absidia repens]
MEFLVGLIKDWSTRVWVISEFNIAKKKNNLKYWFIQLAYNDMEGGEKFTFFKFDFNNLQTPVREQNFQPSVHPISLYFNQLSRQTFLQNILISKASKNEDRFYSILPFSPYQDRKLEVSHWKINTMHP